MTRQMTTDELLEARDVDLGSSDWLEVTQEMIDGFADATGDHQWIHVDPERAAEGPFGQTIAHGYLTISLLPVLVQQLLDVTDRTMGVNYGIDRMRLTSPVPSGSRIRVHGVVKEGSRKGEGVLYRVGVEVEIEGSDRPALVGDVLYLMYGGA